MHCVRKKNKREWRGKSIVILKWNENQTSKGKINLWKSLYSNLMILFHVPSDLPLIPMFWALFSG